jgi:hypothetical protein
MSDNTNYNTLEWPYIGMEFKSPPKYLFVPEIHTKYVRENFNNKWDYIYAMLAYSSQQLDKDKHYEQRKKNNRIQ